MAGITKLILTLLSAGNRVANDDGTASPFFIQLWNNALNNIRRNDERQDEALRQLEEQATMLAEQVALIVELNGLVTDVSQRQEEQEVVILTPGSFIDPQYVASGYATDQSRGGINVQAHTRIYADGSRVSVAGKTIGNLPAQQNYYVYYRDPERKGGTVNYLTTTNALTARQTGDIHNVTPNPVYVPAAAPPE